MDGQMDGQMDRRMDGQMDKMYRFPLFSTGLYPLRFPLGLLPCLHNSYHHEIPEQGKGTDDHLLPLGDWLLTEHNYLNALKCQLLCAFK